MRLLALLACVLWFAIPHARAADGVLFSVAYQNIPAGAAVTVRPWDNSDENVALTTDIETALRQAGYRVVDGADLILSFARRDVIGSWSAGGRRSIIELEGGGGRTGGENARLLLNLYSSDRGGVLNPGEDPKSVVPSKYQIEMTVDSKTGVRYWQGEATAELLKADGFALTKSLIPVLVGKIGKSVKRESFEIP